ncbi:hypothetical protein AAT19DRAFT_11283 [Rhodotorula toruloides]|uniref:Uncharacterized protein n=1 Tax=Rhodotorula toruloides TaxID=5286 RepID=A0A2S9ZXR0_RHOTO|nr:hypothetical protein AAT19DRAFT_11283 [Rhodotorula toruloides]
MRPEQLEAASASATPARQPSLPLPHLVIANSRRPLRLLVRQLVPRHLKMAREPLKGESGCGMVVLER